jgi:hypothetical protein
MIKSVKKITAKVLALLMIVVLGVMLAVNTTYYHAHKQADGTVVYHAHPYNKSEDSQPYKTHHHSKSEFWLLSHLDKIFIAFLFAIGFLLVLKERFFPVYKIIFTKPDFSIYHHDRAPPYKLK